jgi:hypothetical protein
MLGWLTLATISFGGCFAAAFFVALAQLIFKQGNQDDRWARWPKHKTKGHCRCARCHYWRD